MTGENIHYLNTHIMHKQPPHPTIFTVICKYVSCFKINAYNMVRYLGIKLRFFIWSLVYARLHDLNQDDLNRLQNTRGLLNHCKPCQLLQCPECYFGHSSQSDKVTGSLVPLRLFEMSSKSKRTGLKNLPLNPKFRCSS